MEEAVVQNGLAVWPPPTPSIERYICFFGRVQALDLMEDTRSVRAGCNARTLGGCDL